MSKILILGDSYAAYSDQGTWPNYLKEFTNSEIVCKGISGGSNYTTLDNFKKYHDNSYDYIIVLLTNYERIPVVNDRPELCAFMPVYHSGWGKADDSWLPEGYEAGLMGYLKFFHNETFLRWVTKSVINDIENSLYPHQKVIWVDAILNSFGLCNDILGEIKKGIRINGTLFDISVYLEIGEVCGLSWEKYVEKYPVDKRKNHMSMINQEVFARFLSDVISEKIDNLDLKNVEWNKDVDLIFPCLIGEINSI